MGDLVASGEERAQPRQSTVTYVRLWDAEGVPHLLQVLVSLETGARQSLHIDVDQLRPGVGVNESFPVSIRRSL